MESETGFLVVLTNARTPMGISPGESWTVRIEEISGELFPDTEFQMVPVDTAIFDVPVSNYFVSIDDLPAACQPRDGYVQQRFLPEPETTITFRFNVDCSSFLVVRTTTFGQAIDSAFVYRITYPNGEAIFGKAAPTDTIRPDNLVDGDYQVDLTHVASNCVVTSGGGAHRTASVELPRSTVVDFTIICSDEEYRPEILRIGSTLRNGLNAFFLEATDPGSPGVVAYPDIDDYYWDITDCRRNTLLKDGEIGRFGLYRQSSPVRGQDTVRLTVMVEPDFLDPATEPRCIALRVADNDGNTTPVVEEPLGPVSGSPPVISAFNVLEAGTHDDPQLSFELTSSDPDGDLAGSYLRFILAEDGAAWRGITGHAGTTIPVFRYQSSFLSPEDVAEVRVFVIDEHGNFAVASDNDFSR